MNNNIEHRFIQIYQFLTKALGGNGDAAMFPDATDACPNANPPLLLARL